MTKVCSDEELLSRLCALAADQAGLDASGITPESDLFAELNFDSLDVVEFMMKVEDEFGVSIRDEASGGIRSVRQLMRVLKDPKAGDGVLPAGSSA